MISPKHLDLFSTNKQFSLLYNTQKKTQNLGLIRLCNVVVYVQFSHYMLGDMLWNLGIFFLKIIIYYWFWINLYASAWRNWWWVEFSFGSCMFSSKLLWRRWFCFIHIGFFFFLGQDGHDGEDPKQSTADMTVFVSSSTFSE